MLDTSPQDECPAEDASPWPTGERDPRWDQCGICHRAFPSSGPNAARASVFIDGEHFYRHPSC